MALTATRSAYDIIEKQLSLKDPNIVSVSPDRPNIKLCIEPSRHLEDFAAEISSSLRLLRENFLKLLCFVIHTMTAQDYTSKCWNVWGKTKLLFLDFLIYSNTGFSPSLQDVIFVNCIVPVICVNNDMCK